MYAIGIDVSTFQDASTTPQRIDWSKPKQRGVSFVINRAIFGTEIDQDFYHNFEQQKLFGYVRSTYGFLDYRRGLQDMINQARAYANAIKNDVGEMNMAWVDFEQPTSTWPALPSMAACWDLIYAYTDTVEQALGVECNIYTRPSHIKYNLSYWVREVSNGYIVDVCKIPVPDWLRNKKLWVAAWPSIPLTHAGMSLEDYIALVNWQPNLYGQWDNWFIWQYGTPAEGLEMGMESKDIDKNFFNGTEQDLLNFVSDTQGEQHMYKDNAIGLYTTSANWTNPGFHFIVGQAGESWYEPNEFLKPIELKAASENKPFIAYFKFSPDLYIRDQVPMDEALWKPEASDAQLQMFIRALMSRNVHGVIVDVENNLTHDKVEAAPNYLSFAAKIFVGRASDWVQKNKPGAKFFVACSNSFIEKCAPEYNNWIGQYNSCVTQPAVTPLDASYPKVDDKPLHLDNRLTWEMWKYYPNLLLFNGSPEYARVFFGIDPVVMSPSHSASPSASSSISPSCSVSSSFSPSWSISPSLSPSYSAPGDPVPTTSPSIPYEDISEIKIMLQQILTIVKDIWNFLTRIFK